MAIPSFNQLDDVQQKIVGLDPLAEETRRLLVTGPPGSGKSVVAVYRALQVIGEGHEVLFLTYNRTLNAYMQTYRNGVLRAAQAGGGDAGQSGRSAQELSRLNHQLRLQTRDEWIRGWSSGLPRGDSNPEAFDYDWDEWVRYVESVAGGGGSPKWPYLIIDEGQDFPPGFYEFASSLIDHERCPGISVFADENQALRESHNSSIDDICDALGVGAFNEEGDVPRFNINEGDLFLLRTNYRNTKQIYRLAKEYRTGIRTGFTDEPVRSGRRPELVECKNLRAMAEKIVKDRKQRRGDAVVLVDDLGHLGGMVKELRLLGLGDVQYFYGWNKRNRSQQQAKARGLPVVFADKELEFGSDTGRVTVLCDASVKGLEFDDVYLLVLDRNCRKPEVRRQLFVSMSRPRERLTVVAPDGRDRSTLLANLGLDEGSSDFFYKTVPGGDLDDITPF